MSGRGTRSRPALLTIGLAALPPMVLIALNNVAWRNVDFATIVLAYRVVIYAGLVIALVSIYLAIRQIRRDRSYAASAISLLIALAFVVWVGPDAYLDLAELISSGLG